jgi:hypothetical protein
VADNKTQIVITAEDKTAAAFASAKSGLEKFSAAYASLGALAGVGVAASLVAGIKHVIDLGDEMNDLSQKVGISVKDLATWRLAAEQSGTSLEGVAKGVKGLSQYMVQHSDKLREAGITATDANGAMVQLADLFSAMPDGVEKTALAVQIFGKAGMDMIPMLNLGSKGLDEARKKAEDYGKKMAELAPQADKFNDTLRELKLQSELTGLSFTTRLIEPMTQAAEALREARSGADGLYNAMKKLQDLTKSGPLSIFGLAATAADIARPRSIGYTGQKNALGLPMSELEQFDAATEAYMADAPARAAAAEARKRAGGLLDKGAGGTAKAAKAVGSVDDYASRINQAVGGAINNSAVVKSRELNDQLVALGKLFMESGLDAEIYASALEKLTGYTDKSAEETERLNQLLAATPTAKLEEARKDMELLAESLEAGRISEEQFSEAAQARLGTLGDAVKEVDNFARDMGLSFSSAFEDAVIGGKSLSDVLKRAGAGHRAHHPAQDGHRAARQRRGRFDQGQQLRRQRRPARQPEKFVRLRQRWRFHRRRRRRHRLSTGGLQGDPRRGSHGAHPVAAGRQQRRHHPAAHLPIARRVVGRSHAGHGRRQECGGGADPRQHAPRRELRVMTTLTWPTLTRAAPRVLDWSLVPNTQSFGSPLSGAIQTVEMPGARWKASFMMENLTEADSALLQAFLVKLRGRAGRFTLHNFARAMPRGTQAGTPLVKGAAQTGNTLLIDGCTVAATLLAGDYFTVNGELKMIVADATADGAGEMTLTFEPPLRTAPADNAALTLASPTAVFMLASDELKWNTQPGKFSSFPIDCIEAWI